MVTHKGLARTFRAHLEQDFKDNQKVAQEEAPVPAMFDILVPIGAREEARAPGISGSFRPRNHRENQGSAAADAGQLSGGHRRVDLQRRGARVIENQSFDFWKNADSMPKHFLNIAKAVRDRQKKGLDVRIIFRNGFGKERDSATDEGVWA